MMEIILEKRDGETIMVYKADYIPRIGDAVHLPHNGGYRIVDVVHRVSDDIGNHNDKLLWVQVIVAPISRNGVTGNE